MSELRVLLVSGTHGNEVNGPWLMGEWLQESQILNTFGIDVAHVTGNPNAFKQSRRYIDRDLNRSFSKELLESQSNKDYEVIRARNLIEKYGKEGDVPCQIAIDLHSTTADMGTSLVVYGRRPADLAIASLLQSKLGLYVYLHEGDLSQSGFLVESWPCGIVIEIGPVAQSLLDYSIVLQTKLVLQSLFEELLKIKLGNLTLPKKLVVHRHLKSLDYPRNANGAPSACIHPDLLKSNWKPIKRGFPLFIKSDGSLIYYENDDLVVPVFVNEAAYVEKGIALSFTKKEVMFVSDGWLLELRNLFLIK